MATPRKPDPLIVYSDIWDRTICFKDRSGNRRNVDSYQDAREYAAKHGYNGIRVKYAQIS